MADALALWRGRPGSIPKSIKLSVVIIDLPPMQPYPVGLGQSSGDRLSKTLPVNGIKANIMKIGFVYMIFFLLQVKKVFDQQIVHKNVDTNLHATPHYFFRYDTCIRKHSSLSVYRRQI